jgi:carbon-monoxide dehydrogenase medium subunit
MIPAEFEYTAPESLADAIAALERGGEDAKLLAGGHSLIPLMKLRLAAPALLVDLRNVPGIHTVQRENGHWRIGAMTTHAELAHNAGLGLLSQVAGTIADQQVRNRGTIGGSLAHADPAADLPLALLVCDGVVTVQGAAGQRTIDAGELFTDYLTTSIAPGEVLTELRVDVHDGWGFGYEKFARRSEDWAMVGCAVALKQLGDVCEDIRVALSNMGSTPVRAAAVEDALRGQHVTAATIADAASHAADGLNPPADLAASAEFKSHLARVLCRRALQEAAGIG